MKMAVSVRSIGQPTKHGMATRVGIYPVLPPEADEGTDVLLDSLSDHNFYISSSKFPRRIIAEDPTFNRPEIAHLKTLCLNKIASTYNGSESLRRLTAYEKHFLAKRLPLNFPIITATRFVTDDIYWQKRCLDQWEICDLTRYYGSWKVMCLQRTIERLIEELVPDGPEEQLKQLKSLIVAANKFIRRLTIGQLNAVPTLDEAGRPSQTADSREEYRLNFEPILANLPHLEELSLTYGPNKCGQHFDRFMSRITYDEMKSLSAALMPCYNLRVFELHKSELDCVNVNLLVRGLMHLPMLDSLLLPHNLIGDEGAFCIAKLVSGTSKLARLNLANNQIGPIGAEAIAYALAKNNSLEELNMRLNLLREKGCTLLLRALAVNKKLQKLNLASNKMGEKTAVIAGQVLKFNRTLTDVDFSCNLDIGPVGGVDIFEGLEKNSTLVEMDLRWCNCGRNTEYYVHKLLMHNRSLSNVVEKRRKSS